MSAAWPSTSRIAARTWLTCVAFCDEASDAVVACVVTPMSMIALSGCAETVALPVAVMVRGGMIVWALAVIRKATAAGRIILMRFSSLSFLRRKYYNAG